MHHTTAIFPFAPKTPSCFIVMSSFQLLCALEAIADLKIEDFRVVFVFDPKFAPRNEQMRKMAIHFNIQYDEYSYNDIQEKDFYASMGLFAHNDTLKYNRIFVGDYNNLSLIMLASKYAAKNSTIAFTDDGNASIALLAGIRRNDRPDSWVDRYIWYKRVYKKKKIAREELTFELKKREITCTNCIYTIYFDIKTTKFQTHPNFFHNIVLRTPKTEQPNGDVVIIGPALAAFAKQCNIKENELEAIIWKQLSDTRLRHINTEIQFIPHGRDDNPHIQSFCNILNIKYLRISETIELHLLKSSSEPQYVYGFNSTALLTIKRMFPNASTTNWFINKHFNNPFFTFFSTVRDYYEANEIKTDTICFPDPPLARKVSWIISNLRRTVFTIFNKVSYCSK